MTPARIDKCRVFSAVPVLTIASVAVLSHSRRVAVAVPAAVYNDETASDRWQQARRAFNSASALLLLTVLCVWLRQAMRFSPRNTAIPVMDLAVISRERPRLELLPKGRS
jgi:hypothetical protein